MSIVVAAQFKKGITLDPTLRKTIRSYAAALTTTAEDGQQASIKAIKSTFTTRGKWYSPRTPVGIKRDKARSVQLRARVHTSADWLEPHESGGIKRPEGRNLAVPSKNVRRTKLGKIGKAQRPRNLRRTFVVKTKRGRKALIQRKFKGKRSRTEFKYLLIPRARIRKQSTFYDPIRKTLKRNFRRNLDQALVRNFSKR